MTLNVIFDIGPSLALLGAHLMTVAEFVQSVKDQLAALQAKSASEHEQVMAAIEALKNAVTDIVPDSVANEISALFAGAGQGVDDIYNPPTP